MRKLPVSLFVSSALFSSAVLMAQVPVQISPPGGPDGSRDTVYVTSGLAMPGAGPGQIGLVSHELSLFPGKPITGAPYSADQVIEHVQTLADGNRIVNTTTTKIYRDSQGRTRTETSLPAMPGGPTPPAMITIHDPVAGVTYLINPENKTAHKLSAKSLSITLDAGATHTGPEVTTAFAPPPMPPPGMGGPMTFVTTRDEPGAKGNEQTQSLGNQSIQGVAATGTRFVSTIPAGAIGNEQPIEVISERWFSQALQVVMKSVHTDPRIGQTTESLQNLSLTEPNPALFQVPSDYTVSEAGVPQIRRDEVKR